MSSRSTFSNSTSKSYAMALYELSKESSELNKVEDGLRGLKKLLIENSRFKEIILSPTVSKDEKKNVMLAIADQNNFSITLKNFLGFISTKNRLFFLNKVIDSFLNLVSSSKGELKAKIVSSKKLSIEEQKKIQTELSENFKSKLKIASPLSSSIILPAKSIFLFLLVKVLKKSTLGSKSWYLSSWDNRTS